MSMEEASRPFWLHKIEQAWEKKNIVWLAGVRRSGKTTLGRQFADAAFYNCDLKSVQEEIRDPEAFLKKQKKKVVILDEIHQLPEASLVLKIAADEFKNLKILATGSSTLLASQKFKDSLTDRKRTLHLPPVLVAEREQFGFDLEARMKWGGLPPAFLKPSESDEFYSDWMDSFYARDIQELFKIEKRQAFLKVLEFLFIHNGKQLDVTELSKVSGVTRPTAIKYLEALELTKAITLISPFSQNPLQEIVSQPRVYAFDCGFVRFCRQHRDLRPEDRGEFLENLTLETFQAFGFQREIHYWRTKQQKEVDFVMTKDSRRPLAIECKWKSTEFNSAAMKLFRQNYPQGENWLIVGNDTETHQKSWGDLSVEVIPITKLHLKLMEYTEDSENVSAVKARQKERGKGLALNQFAKKSPTK